MNRGRYLKSVRSALPENAQADLDRAFSGDALAARRLMLIAPRRLRGHIAFLAYQSKIGNPAYREIVKAVWAPETRPLLTAFWRPQIVRRMLARAEFRIPQFSGPLTIFRLVRGGQVKKASAELCWSLSREGAIADAARTRPARPGILQATIDPADIIYWGESYGEQEIVGRGPVYDAVLIEPAGLIRAASSLTQAVGADYPASSHHR